MEEKLLLKRNKVSKLPLVQQEQNVIFEREFNSKIIPMPVEPSRVLEWQTVRDESIKSYLASRDIALTSAIKEDLMGMVEEKWIKDNGFFDLGRDGFNQALYEMKEQLTNYFNNQ